MGAVASVTFAHGGPTMAVTERERPAHGKKKAGRPRARIRGGGLQVRIAPDVVRMARVITPLKGVALTNYLSDNPRPVVTRDYAQAARKLSLEGGEK